jgi:hypothetical protein
VDDVGIVLEFEDPLSAEVCLMLHLPSILGTSQAESNSESNSVNISKSTITCDEIVEVISLAPLVVNSLLGKKGRKGKQQRKQIRKGAKFQDEIRTKLARFTQTQ